MAHGRSTPPFSLAACAVVLCAGCARRPKPSFVIRDDKDPSEAIAVFLDSAVVTKHGVQPEQYQAAFEQYSAWLFDKVLVPTVVEMIAPDGRPDEQQPDARPPTLAIPWDAFVELFNTARVEEWHVAPDGTHSVVRLIPVKPFAMKPDTR